MFAGFRLDRIETAEATINFRIGGAGPPVLLLHGYPQTHVMRHHVAPYLARDFTVICADLRGYGDSSKPPSTPDHAPYSKRAMARDMVEAMQALGFERFHVVGHDRGGRVAYRMAPEHPTRGAGYRVPRRLQRGAPSGCPRRIRDSTAAADSRAQPHDAPRSSPSPSSIPDRLVVPRARAGCSDGSPA